MSLPTFVVVGAGQAGGWAAKTLRDEGFEGRIVLFGREKYAPYERPPLSKGLLTGKTTISELTLFSREALAQLDIEFKPTCQIRRLNPAHLSVETELGEKIRYDKLLLSTGGRALVPQFPGSDSRDVMSLRTAEDANRIKSRLEKPSKHVVVIGAGWVGLEVAATARTMGHEVTVIEMTERACSRSVMPAVSERLGKLHQTNGVKLLVNTQVCAIKTIGTAESCVMLTTGETVRADIIILGVGLVPNDELARSAGLNCNKGVVVDASCMTSDPHIFAAGDVSVIQYQNPAMQCRLESWQNAQDQGIAAARAMLGKSVSYQPVPLVWSEQFDAMIQIAGHAQLTKKTVVRSTADIMPALVFGLDSENRVVAAVGINGGREFRNARKLVETNSPVDPIALADPSIALASTVQA